MTTTSDFTFGSSPLTQQQPLVWSKPLINWFGTDTPPSAAAMSQPAPTVFGSVPTQTDLPVAALSGNAPSAYAPMINSASAYYGVAPDILSKQLQQESSFNPRASSPAGAQGIAQFMPGTAARYGVNPWDPKSSIEGQAHYMSDLKQQFHGNTGLALAGYNWGEGNVQRWLKSSRDVSSVPKETRDYVQRITGRSLQDWASQ